MTVKTSSGIIVFGEELEIHRMTGAGT